MSLISIPYIFQPGTVIASSQVNADFAAIVGVVNGNLDATNFATVFTQWNKSAKGSLTIAGGLIINWGSPNGVPFDNSAANTPMYDTPFTNSVFGVWCQVDRNTLTTASLVVPYVNSITNTGFNLTAMGGKVGDTGTVNWLAIGY